METEYNIEERKRKYKILRELHKYKIKYHDKDLINAFSNNLDYHPYGMKDRKGCIAKGSYMLYRCFMYKGKQYYLPILYIDRDDYYTGDDRENDNHVCLNAYTACFSYYILNFDYGIMEYLGYDEYHANFYRSDTFRFFMYNISYKYKNDFDSGTQILQQLNLGVWDSYSFNLMIKNSIKAYKESRKSAIESISTLREVKDDKDIHSETYSSLL